MSTTEQPSTPQDRLDPFINHRRPEYLDAIIDALKNGYTVNAEKGVIYGKKGSPLIIKSRGNQRYPTVPLVTPNMSRRFYSVPAHKVIAYALWGEAAFAPEINVRHLSGDTTDCRASNLALGTSSENQMDKSPEVRKAAGRKARAAQGTRFIGRKLTMNQANEILKEYEILKSQTTKKKLKNGSIQQIIDKYQISKSTFYLLIHGKTYVTDDI